MSTISLPRTHVQGQVVYYEVRCQAIINGQVILNSLSFLSLKTFSSFRSAFLSQVFSDVIFKRFSDFYDLDTKLRKAFPKETFPDFPPYAHLWPPVSPRPLRSVSLTQEKDVWQSGPQIY
jgi:hypothetical protein